MEITVKTGHHYCSVISDHTTVMVKASNGYSENGMDWISIEALRKMLTIAEAAERELASKPQQKYPQVLTVPVTSPGPVMCSDIGRLPDPPDFTITKFISE